MLYAAKLGDEAIRRGASADSDYPVTRHMVERCLGGRFFHFVSRHERMVNG
jgi:hypothetical protein